MEKLKSLYICAECGMTHFCFKKPQKCKNCGLIFNLEKEVKIRQCRS